jgi:hypothetical protein
MPRRSSWSHLSTPRPTVREAEFGQSGNGPATTGNGVLFVGAGNGSFEPSQQNYGDSFVKLLAGTLKVVDYFTPIDQQSLADNDVDFGIASPLLLPPQSPVQFLTN